jgi:topoisomerase-4 subunit A
MFGPRPPYVGIFDREKIFSIIYRDGARGRYYAKRFQMGGVTRDTFYDLTKGTKGSKLVYFAAHNSPETSAKQRLMIHYQPAPRLRKLEEEFDFSTLEIKSRSANGNIIAENPVKRFTLVR